MKKIIIVILALILLIGGIYYLILINKPKDYIETFGNIEIRTVDLSFQVSGVIKNIYFEEGDYVKKGQLLAVLDDKDYKVKYQKALSQEKSFLAQKEEDVSKYERNIPLCSDDTISKQDCTTFLNKKDLSKAKYEESVAERKFQKLQLDYTKLFAPQDGIITTRAQEIGARVNINQTVFTMSLPKPVWVRTYITEKDLGKIKYGTLASVLTDTDIGNNSKKEYEGYVGYISPVAEFTPKTVQTQDLRVDLVYRIRVYIKDVDEYLRQGMPVSVRLKPKEETKKNE